MSSRDFFQEYEHLDFGSVQVFWRIEAAFEGAVPFMFEADLLTPDSELEALTKWMDRVRLDRSVSVSASEFQDGSQKSHG